MKSRILSPSLLSADFSNLAEALKLCEEKKSGAVHIDVMDGHFVPQITYGQPVIKSVRKLTSLPFDVHLMVERPEEMVDTFAQAGADWITFHQEATVHIDRLISHIHSLGKKAGISIVPSTPVNAIKEIFPEVDLVLVMTVEPGFGGQKLLQPCVDKVHEVSRMCKMFDAFPEIEVDGGITADNVGDLIQNGANVIVAGSAVFKAPDTEKAVRVLKGDLSDL